MNEILDAINRIANNMDGDSSTNNSLDVLFTIDIPEGEGSILDRAVVTCNKTAAEIKAATDSNKIINAVVTLDTVASYGNDNYSMTDYFNVSSYSVMNDLPSGTIYSSLFSFFSTIGWFGDYEGLIYINIDSNNEEYFSLESFSIPETQSGPMH